jgi:hypothetical protein
MAISKRRTLFNRIFFGLTLVWIGNCLVILPARLKHRADDRFVEAVGRCEYAVQVSEDRAAESACMTQAEGLYVVDRTTASTFYDPRVWPSLLLVCVGFPLVTYSFLLGAGLVVGRTSAGAGTLRSQVS